MRSMQPNIHDRKEVSEEMQHHESIKMPLLLKADEVAQQLGLGRSKVYEMIASGDLPVVRIGTAVRVPRAGLDDWIEINTTAAA